MLLGFLPLIPVTRESTLVSLLQTIESHVADQLHSPVRPRLHRRNHFSTFFIHLPFKNYPAKVDRWLEKLNRQKWTPDNHIKLHIWSVCANTESNKYDLEFLDSACVKIQNIGFKTSKMDQIVLQYWYYSFLRPLRVNGGGFLLRWADLKKGSPDQKSKCRTYAETCHSPFKGSRYHGVKMSWYHDFDYWMRWPAINHNQWWQPTYLSPQRPNEVLKAYSRISKITHMASIFDALRCFRMNFHASA